MTLRTAEEAFIRRNGKTGRLNGSNADWKMQVFSLLLIFLLMKTSGTRDETKTD